MRGRIVSTNETSNLIKFLAGYFCRLQFYFSSYPRSQMLYGRIGLIVNGFKVFIGLGGISGPARRTED